MLRHFTSKLRPPRINGIKIFAIVSPYGLAKKYLKKTLNLYIIPPAPGVAYGLHGEYINLVRPQNELYAWTDLAKNTEFCIYIGRFFFMNHVTKQPVIGVCRTQAACCFI